MPAERRDDEELYWLVRRAVTDAVWDVVGTATLTVVYAVMALVGVQVLASTLTARGAAGDPAGLLGVVLGGVFIALPGVGLYRLWVAG